MLSGEVDLRIGCRFHTRRPFAMGRGSRLEPVREEVAPGHLVASHLHTAAA